MEEAVGDIEHSLLLESLEACKAFIGMEGFHGEKVTNEELKRESEETNLPTDNEENRVLPEIERELQNQLKNGIFK